MTAARRVPDLGHLGVQLLERIRRRRPRAPCSARSATPIGTSRRIARRVADEAELRRLVRDASGVAQLRDSRAQQRETLGLSGDLAFELRGAQTVLTHRRVQRGDTEHRQDDADDDRDRRPPTPALARAPSDDAQRADAPSAAGSGGAGARTAIVTPPAFSSLHADAPPTRASCARSRRTTGARRSA